MPKQVYTWGNVEAGDIISFRYKSLIEEGAQSKTTTLLVLNPKYPKKLKNGPKWPIYAGFGHFWDIKVTISRKCVDNFFLNFSFCSHFLQLMVHHLV